MRRIAIGLAAGVAIWVGSAVAAEAQTIQIQPVGPTAVRALDISAMVLTDITPGSTNTFYVRVKVYVEGELKYTSPVNGYTTTGTKHYMKNVPLTALGLIPGKHIVFRTECSWTNTDQGFVYSAETPAITIGS